MFKFVVLLIIFTLLLRSLSLKKYKILVTVLDFVPPIWCAYVVASPYSMNNMHAIGSLFVLVMKRKPLIVLL